MKRKREKLIAYVFGYGSLMYPKGINGRGMRHIYKWADLSPAEIVGYKRGLLAAFAGRTFYGLMAAPTRTVNGILLPIFSKRDINALWRDEGATKKLSMYRVKEVSAKITPKMRNNMPIYTLTNVRDRSAEGKTPLWYMSNVWRGIEPWGEDFRRRFINTGGVKPDLTSTIVDPIYDLYESPLRTLYKTPWRIWRNLFGIN